MTTASQMIRAAESHLGEGPWPTWSWWNRTQYNAGTGWAWCAAFQSKVATECGLKHTDSASAAGFGGQFKRVKTPKAGDIVTFNWDGRDDVSWCDHVALVTGVGQNCIYTIDGNSGGDNLSSTVRRNTYWLNASYFCAFWRPTYAAEKFIPSISVRDYDGKWRGPTRYGTAGEYGKNIAYLVTNATGGRGYRVKPWRYGWLNYIVKNDRKDLDYGCAGNGHAVHGIEITDPRIDFRFHIKGLKWRTGPNKGKYKWSQWRHGGGKHSHPIASRVIDKVQIRVHKDGALE